MNHMNNVLGWSIRTINDRQMVVEPKMEEVSLSLSGSKGGKKQDSQNIKMFRLLRKYLAS